MKVVYELRFIIDNLIIIDKFYMYDKYIKVSVVSLFVIFINL